MATATSSVHFILVGNYFWFIPLRPLRVRSIPSRDEQNGYDGVFQKNTYSVYGMLHGLGINASTERELARNFAPKLFRHSHSLKSERKLGSVVGKPTRNIIPKSINKTNIKSLNYNLKAKILWKIILYRPFAANDHMVQNPPCWRASSLLFPHWDIKTKESQDSLVQVSFF